MSNFKIGDKVRVINYGHLMWINIDRPQPEGLLSIPAFKTEGSIRWIDMQPHLIGSIGVVESVINTKPTRYEYSLNGISGKTAWYSQDQLELATYENG